MRPAVRSDSAIEEEIWHRLSQENPVVFSPEHVAVEVEQGEVQLWGHVADEGLRQRARLAAAQVPGVTQVTNRIIQDCDLCARVMRALDRDERTTAYLIPVKCASGWVSLGGIVPTQEAAEVVEMVAASVPEVRGVVGVPWVVGLPWATSSPAEPVRRIFQPRIGAVVHESLPDILSGSEALTGNMGIVAQVVIDPRSRLLTHIVVQAHEKKVHQRALPAEKYPRGQIIPVSAIEAANREHVWLKAGEAICSYPVFHAGQYPGIPQDWRPPFPYRPEMVRWSSY